MQRKKNGGAKLRDWLIEKRKHKQLTMLEMAEMANISESYYCLIESGARKPSTGVAKRIASALDFDWVRFYDDSSDIMTEKGEQNEKY
jgi:transcriptional regulator with XRE-family HTH domain